MSIKAASDNSIYDPLELGYALTDDIPKQLALCAERHSNIFDEPQFCLVLIVAKDPMLHNIRRHKYYAYPYLPSPRPGQSVFLYHKANGNCKRLWTLPEAKTMAIISEMPIVDAKWQCTKYWCDSFFNHTFWEAIRAQHEINLLSETEFLNANRAELIKAGCNEFDIPSPDPFDFSKVSVKQVVDQNKSIL